jgi:hypothetical protein
VAKFLELFKVFSMLMSVTQRPKALTRWVTQYLPEQWLKSWKAVSSFDHDMTQTLLCVFARGCMHEQLTALGRGQQKISLQPIYSVFQC